jgi:predicted tellurium resistance membrane protein TerC
MEALFSYELLLSFITLTFLEIILGIDNIIFIALVVDSLPPRYKNKARYIGIGLALIIRIIMLFTLSWVMSLTKPLFNLAGIDFSFNNLLLIVGGIFLIVKSGLEIKNDVKGAIGGEKEHKITAKESFFGAVVQIAIIDFIFSFDSIITAIGMTRNIPVIVAAVVISMLIMLFASGKISYILSKYPSLKIMALAFIFMIGVILLVDGLHMHISKYYLYFALFFSIAVETLNIIAKKR